MAKSSQYLILTAGLHRDHLLARRVNRSAAEHVVRLANRAAVASRGERAKLFFCERNDDNRRPAMPATDDRLRKIWETLCWIEADDRDGRLPPWPPESWHATAVLCGVSVATVRQAYDRGMAEDWDVPQLEDLPPPDEADEPVIVEGQPCSH